jgi:hypothetical protein
MVDIHGCQAQYEDFQVQQLDNTLKDMQIGHVVCTHSCQVRKGPQLMQLDAFRGYNVDACCRRTYTPQVPGGHVTIGGAIANHS